jgi:hypothetical protein
MISHSIHISIWREFKPRRPLTHVDRRFDTNDAELWEEVFSWRTEEDCFGGIEDAELRKNLHDLLVERFQPERPPEERQMQRLREFIDAAREAISRRASEWTACGDAPDDNEYPYRINALLALTDQIEWILNSYLGHPGISVVVR